MGCILVGVDGGSTSRAAVRWAARYAKTSGDVVELVHVMRPTDWDTPAFGASERAVPGWVAEDVQPALQREERSIVERHETHQRAVAHKADAEMEELVHSLGRELDGVQVERVVLCSRHVTDALVGLTADADLLVVGRRARGMGSVSTGCVNHASCPVVVVSETD